MKRIFCILMGISTLLIAQRGYAQQEQEKDRISFGNATINQYMRENRPRLWQTLAELRMKYHYRCQYEISDWTKVSDLVVIGEVLKIEGHPESPYHTWVTVRVDTVLKGQAESKEIIVKIISGPLDEKGRYSTRFNIEPEFVEKEKVLLFLSTVPWNLWVYGAPPGTTGKYFDSASYFKRYKRTEGYFEIWDRCAKWHIQDKKATQFSRARELNKIVEEINETQKINSEE